MPGASPAPAAPLIPLAVRRGNTVLTVWTPAPGLAVTARLEALDDGRLGETIRLRNRDTGRVLSAQISGPNQAVGQ
jgi:flagella basal body P-ring formation protein FlgA